MKRPLVLLLYSEVWGLGPQPLPYPQIALFKNGKVNLPVTFAGMTAGQMIPIRLGVKEHRARVRATAHKVKIRIKIEDWSMDTILVTSLGPQSKHKTKTTALSALLPRKRCFKPLPSAQPGNQIPDIFS